MGNADTKLHFRKAVIQLTTKTQVGFFTLNSGHAHRRASSGLRR
ncbi:Protein HID1 [Liparis tanakae]|uniref:Protein HID1 n=1 Tax=Liparis tanakae TaxID=230148 RepID=A0A4Z2ER98_9TELE|nr:Protein HID1 [Liparis tanakae]